ncbi:MAG TPA: mucoidy inhibitor MuiA family protein [Myxococcota bacterium]|nr:mucoidy inhibitor MuiA family protein [Myxococcota bacterium]HRY96399.1 mucoidy inhibitor MuiA family protein [Myxococcota bacterium]HSA20835.1 mucoidy inhibitor MuiA family protein [Myxococcota bacterium]
MDTRIVLSLTVGLALTTGAVRAEDPAPPIEKVVVFADRADVTRSTAATCQAGRAEVVFSGLPTGIDQRTLRADASGKAKAIGTTSRLVPLEEDRDVRVAALRKELQAAYDEQRRLEEELQGLAERGGGVDGYGNYFQTLAREEARNAKPDLGAWERVLDFMRLERLNASERRVELQVSLRKKARELQRLERRLARLAPSAVAEALSVAVAVECRGEERPRVSLSYVVPGATWKPEYDLRFLPRSGKVGPGKAELTVAVVVQQSTGEDWQGVELNLSTAKPRLGAEAPYPAPIVIQGYKAGEQKILVDAMEKREQLAGPGDTAAAAGPQSASFEDRGQSCMLTMPRKASVQADGRPYWMPLDVVSADASAKLITIPRLKPYVFQVVQLKNPAAYPLLPGRLHAYRSGSYVGDTKLEYKAAGEPMEVSLGLDEELRIERKPIEERDREAGALSTKKHIDRAYRFKLSNGSRGGVPVEIREGVPVSKTEEVEIEIVKDDTSPGYQLDKHRGILSWVVDLKPGEKKELDLRYSIHLPEDWQVNLR